MTNETLPEQRPSAPETNSLDATLRRLNEALLCAISTSTGGTPLHQHNLCMAVQAALEVRSTIDLVDEIQTALEPEGAEGFPRGADKSEIVDESSGAEASPVRRKGRPFDLSGRFDMSTIEGTKAWEADYKHREAIRAEAEAEAPAQSRGFTRLDVDTQIDAIFQALGELSTWVLARDQVEASTEEYTEQIASIGMSTDIIRQWLKEQAAGGATNAA